MTIGEKVDKAVEAMSGAAKNLKDKLSQKSEEYSRKADSEALNRENPIEKTKTERMYETGSKAAKKTSRASDKASDKLKESATCPEDPAV